MIIPFFLPHAGCRQRCIFCAASVLGETPQVHDRRDFCQKIDEHLATERHTGETEVAFYGANFTGIPQEEQEKLLGWAKSYVTSGQIGGIRISTRPDYIYPGNVGFLQEHGVSTVEVGAQSLDDGVLQFANRGHRASDVERAVMLLKGKGIKTSLHLMAGLPLDDHEGFMRTVREAIKIGPSMVRIHPTLVFPGTRLADFWQRGEYSPLSLTEATTLCALATEQFLTHGIAVIRLGLQLSSDLPHECLPLAGPYHQSFGSLVYENLLDRAAAEIFRGESYRGQSVVLTVSAKDGGISAALLPKWEKKFAVGKMSLRTDKKQRRGTVIVARG